MDAAPASAAEAGSQTPKVSYLMQTAASSEAGFDAEAGPTDASWMSAFVPEVWARVLHRLALQATKTDAVEREVSLLAHKKPRRTQKRLPVRGLVAIPRALPPADEIADYD